MERDGGSDVGAGEDGGGAVAARVHVMKRVNAVTHFITNCEENLCGLCEQVEREFSKL